MKPARAFTLLETLLALTLTAVLLVGVLSVTAALARDARRSIAKSDPLRADAVFALLRWDLANSRSVEVAGGGRTLVFIGHGGIDRQSLRPNGRLTRVVYEIEPRSGLVRRQHYLDDQTRQEPWGELMLIGATSIEAPGAATRRLDNSRIPGALQLRIELRGGRSIDRILTR